MRTRWIIPVLAFLLATPLAWGLRPAHLPQTVVGNFLIALEQGDFDAARSYVIPSDFGLFGIVSGIGGIAGKSSGSDADGVDFKLLSRTVSPDGQSQTLSYSLAGGQVMSIGVRLFSGDWLINLSSMNFQSGGGASKRTGNSSSEVGPSDVARAFLKAMQTKDLDLAGSFCTDSARRVLGFLSSLPAWSSTNPSGASEGLTIISTNLVDSGASVEYRLDSESDPRTLALVKDAGGWKVDLLADQQ